MLCTLIAAGCPLYSASQLIVRNVDEFALLQRMMATPFSSVVTLGFQ